MREWSLRPVLPAPPPANDVSQLAAERIAEYAAVAAAVAEPGLVSQVATAAALFVDVYRSGGQALIFGNGGSAADASHLAAEFVGRCTRDRRPLPAIALGDATATVTALANDFGYQHVFARQLEAHGRPADLAVAFTTSGRSPNVLEGLAAARRLGIRSLVLTGRDGEGLREVADLVLVAPSNHTGRVQEVHQMWAHLFVEAVEVALFQD